MKQNNYKPSQVDLSSIAEQSNTQSDVELEQIDMAKMNCYEYYTALDPQSTQVFQIEGEYHIKEMFNRLIKKVIDKAQENEILRKLPTVSASNSLNLLVMPLAQAFYKPENPIRDIQSGGLGEDFEPLHIQQEQWLTSKINMEIKPENRPNTCQTSSPMTFARSKVFDQQTIKEKKQLDPMPIDLVDPLDISITEEQLRNEKERQTKEKLELNEAEKRRKLKEEKEEQLKYELMAKDKKSKQYTYDYDGKLISVNTAKGTKLPPPASTLASKFEEDQSTKINPKKKYNKVPWNNKKTDDEKDKEKDTFKFNQIAPLVVENMNLQPGIVVTHEGRIKEGTRPNTVDLQNMNNPALRMARNEYLSLTQQMNSTINNNIQVHAEDKPIKEIDKGKGFNYDRFKRLTQQSNNQLGVIKINSTKIFEQLAQAFFEEPEELPKIINQQTSKSSQENTLKGVKSPVDQFNLSLYKNNVVGKDQQNEIGINYEKLKTLKANSRFEILYRFKIQQAKRKKNVIRIKYITYCKKPKKLQIMITFVVYNLLTMSVINYFIIIMELLRDPSHDRVVKTLKPPPHRPLSHQLIFPDKLKNKPDWRLLLDHLSKEGRIAKEDLIKLVSECNKIFKNEGNLIYLHDPLTVVGDIHGQYYDLVKMFDVGGNIESTKYLFLGDFVDRGSFSIEVIVLVYAIKINFPNTVFFLRGNHECRQLTSFFNFKDECIQKKTLSSRPLQV
ncbi:unnamed protein product [Paramecium pentaurelia]|uniref:Serine/threonine-protein phosphatase n=1 Tax=Paramecium pentaurelia TaxID=43138 RepID=A0A8S1VGN1_9CILI|nr:unnamed protein product [Paramecium pentaurelia]